MNAKAASLASSWLFAAALLAPRAHAQGSFSNFETPQTHPIDVATVANEDYVLVCNTPDNSVDIYAAAPPHAFVQRVPVGMGPATVRWSAAHGRFYTCNFDGDSISVVRLDVSGSSVVGVLERTSSVGIGDEPSDIAFGTDDQPAIVSLSSSSSVRLIDPFTLVPSGAPVLLSIPVGSGTPFAVKMPRQIAWLPDGRFFAANLRGGSPFPLPSPLQYDVGIYRNSSGVSGTADSVGGLGTTNHAFAFHSAGNLMFVVGTKARNHDAVGVAAAAALPTGFVQSWLMVVDVPTSGAMTVRAEATPVTTPATTLRSLNLNRDYTASGTTPVPVDTSLALVQPTDVLVLEPNGAVAQVVLTAFHSDRVALLAPSTTTPGGWDVSRVDVPVPSTGGYTVSGPRGIAFSATEGLLFTNGRLDNSLTVIDPATAAITAQLQLPNDPTPAVIRTGRQFLYSNRFSIDDSGPSDVGGFVSCAVCHVDGRTDGLKWDLGDAAAGPAILARFHDENGETTTTMPNFPAEKGPMVTQTLQGLVNYEVNEIFQVIATNAPYHWRGDKNDFTDFNEAFVNLQGMDDVATSGGPKGISDPDMVAYRRFVNTILHPSNPEQDLARVTTGTLGTNPNDPTTATGEKLGALLFHDFPMVGHRSCVDCHSLPDGSTNTSTLVFPVELTLSSPGNFQDHPLESAALRNIAQREAGIFSGSTLTQTAWVANSGLLHPGDLGFLTSTSINTFVQTNFTMPAPPTTNDVQEGQALTEFVRKLDTGTAPAAGFAYTVDPSLSPLNSGANQTWFDLLEQQAEEANIGLGVYSRDAGTVRGWYYDVTVMQYREEGTTNLASRATLLGLAVGTGDVVIAQGTPLGTDRRWASPTGVATTIVGTNAASNLVLLPMAPSTAFLDVPLFNGNLNLSAGSDSSIWTQRTYQSSVAGSFGVPSSLRHEPPRRFRVTGDDIRVGAKLYFAIASGTTAASFPVEIVEMPLFPTRYFADEAEEERIWETRVELDPTHTFALLNGGYWAPDVVNVLFRLTATPSLQPATWNQFLIGVENEDLTFGYDLTWDVLSIQDGR